MMSPHPKKGQIEITFNWVYILIAGAIILLFFVGLVVRQKAVSEEHLAVDLVGVLESLFTGAGVSERTKNVISTSGLADYTLEFQCAEGVTSFGIQGRGARAENNLYPVFSPAEIKTTQLILWSLPYQFPFKVMDFLLVTSGNTKYYLIGNDAAFVEEFLNATEGLNREYILRLADADPGKNFQVRIIDVDGQLLQQPFPEQLQGLDDDKVSGVSLVNERHAVNYYQKEGSGWKWLNQRSGPLPIISLGGERDAALYAALFSADGAMYQCNMQKAFRRLQYLLEVYGGERIYQQPGGKLQELLAYHLALPESRAGNPCLGHLQEYDPNIRSALLSLQTKLPACLLEEARCVDLLADADELRLANQNLRRSDCLALY